jgi:hypothetical protein
MSWLTECMIKWVTRLLARRENVRHLLCLDEANGSGCVGSSSDLRLTCGVVGFSQIVAVAQKVAALCNTVRCQCTNAAQ